MWLTKSGNYFSQCISKSPCVGVKTVLCDTVKRMYTKIHLCSVIFFSMVKVVVSQDEYFFEGSQGCHRMRKIVNFTHRNRTQAPCITWQFFDTRPSMPLSFSPPCRYWSIPRAIDDWSAGLSPLGGLSLWGVSVKSSLIYCTIQK